MAKSQPMTNQNEKASGASSAPLDPEDREALERAQPDSSGNQGPALSSPGEGGPKGAPSPTPQAQLFAGHVAMLCNEFFLKKFGAENGLSGGMLDAIKLDTAAAIDLYLPNVDAKPGMFSALVLIGHYIQCARNQQTVKPLASSDRAEPEKQPS